MIALCSTCKGRVQHLKQTLRKNLDDNFDSQYNAKYIILDYGSPDDLLPWLAAEFKSEIADGIVVVYSILGAGAFHMAHAKNVAHRCGMLEGANVLVNVDADNYIGAGFVDWIGDTFCEGKPFLPKVFTWAGMIKGQGRRLRGTSGRIAMTSTAFLLTNGYDEKYQEWGPDDKDMNARLKMLEYEDRVTPREFLASVVHTDGVRFKEYPHVKECIEASGDLPVNPCSPIANFGHFGCAVVYRNFDFTKPIQLEPLPTRVFGIGMHKTATRSLHRALQMLGFHSEHWESGQWARQIMDEMRDEGRSITVERSYALSDLPIPLLFKELDRAYPGSKFILTTKDEAEWLRSVRNHWKHAVNPFRYEWDKWPISNRIHKLLYGQKEYDAVVFLNRYRAHNEEVKAYFKDRPNDLCVMHMDDGAGWPELCGLLRKPIPDIVYPNVKFTAEC